MIMDSIDKCKRNPEQTDLALNLALLWAGQVDRVISIGPF